MSLNRLKKGVVIAASGIVVTGTSFLSNSITGASSLNISGLSSLNSTTIRSTLNVSGNSSIQGAVTLSSTLNVSGTTNINGGMVVNGSSNQSQIVSNSSSGLASMYFTTPTANAYLGLGSASFAGSNYAGNMFIQSPSNIVFNVNGNGGSVAPAMYIGSSGSVGIGTTTPNSTLQVNGTTILNGATTINSTLNVSGNSSFNNLNASGINVANSLMNINTITSDTETTILANANNIIAGNNVSNITNPSPGIYRANLQNGFSMFTLNLNPTITLINESDYTYSINITCSSSGSIQINLTDGTNTYRSILLTTEYVTYTGSFKALSNNNIYFSILAPFSNQFVQWDNFTLSRITTITTTSTNMYINKLGIGMTNPTTLLQVSGSSLLQGDATVSSTLNVSGNTTIMGNMGVGTTNPLYNVDVNTGTIGLGNRLMGKHNSNDYFWLGLKGTGSETDRVALGIAGDTTTGQIQTVSLNVMGSSRITIPSTGNVGIGTTSPAAKLHVEGDMIVGNSTGANSIFINDIPNARWRIGTGGYGLNFFKHTGTSSSDFSSWSQRMVLDQNGYLGIGTTSPSTTLHVSGNSIINGSISGGSSFTLYNSGYDVGFSVSTGNTTTYTSIETFNGANNVKKILALNPWGGNVAIGTTVPEAKLHVNGDINFVGSLYHKGSPFTVGGNINTFYPVAIDSTASWETAGKFYFGINRGNVHLDASWRGSLTSWFEGHNYGWGNGANYLAWNIVNTVHIANYNRFIANITQTETSNAIIIWLRGNTSYYFTGVGCTLYFSNSSGSTSYTVPLGNGSEVYTSQSTVNSNFDYPTVVGNTMTNVYNSSGNMGIGTSTPNSVLHLAKYVTANSDFSLMVSFENTNAGYHEWMMGPHVLNGAAYFSIIGGNTNSFSGLSTNVFNIAGGTGNVGIGITSPSELLDVNGNVKSNGMMVNGANVIELGRGVTKEPNAGKIGYQTFTSGALDIVGAGTANRIIKMWDDVVIGGNITVGSNINFTGNLYQNGTPFVSGGGSSTVLSTLTVSGTATIGTSITLPTNPSTSVTNILNFKNTQGYGMICDTNNISSRGNTLDFKGYDYNFGGITTRNVLSIHPNGNVGIGTTNPTQELHVLTTTGNTDIRIETTVVNGQYIDIGTSPSLYHFIYGYTNIPMIFATNNAERMRINGNGNVGIGTTSPGVNLDVMKAGRSGTHGNTGNIALYVTSDGAGYSDGMAEFRHSNGTQGIGIGYSGIYATGSNANQDINMVPRGTGNFIVRSGNVGIGTDSPDNKLTVKGVIQVTDVSSDQKYGIYSDNSNLQINPRNSSGGYNTIDGIFMNSSGNVGIGGVPNTKFDVKGAIYGNGIYCLVNSDTTSNGYVTLMPGGANNTGYIEFRNAGTTRQGYIGFGSASDFYFSIEESRNLLFNTSNIERMRIASNGYVGIGTSSPAGTLQINGQGNILNIYNTTSSTNYIRMDTNAGAGVMFIGMDNSSGIGLFGSGTAYGACIGSATATSFNIATSNAIRMTVSSGGFVGIGTTNPATTLNVVGGFLLSGTDLRMNAGSGRGDSGLGRAMVHDSATVLAINYNGDFTGGVRMDSKMALSSGDNSKITYGPNTTWSGYMCVGACTSSLTAATCQMISTNGNLHIDAGYGKQIYINYYANGSDPTYNATNYNNSTIVYGGITMNGTTTMSGAITANNTMTINSTTYCNGKLVIQNSTDGGNTRGIWIWNDGDSNWGIYMASSGAGKSLAAGTACAGDGFDQHAIRIRTTNGATQGFIYENSSEVRLFSVRGSDGYASFAGPVYGASSITGNEMYTNNWFRVNGGGGLYWQSYGRGIQSADSAGATYGNISTYATGINSWNGYDINGRYTFMASGDMFGLHDKNYSWAFYANNADVYIPRNVGVTGNLTCTGDITAFGTVSDARLKTNINKLDSSISIIKLLNPVTFNWKDDIYNKEYRSKEDVGFIAQEVEQVIPYAVGEFKVENDTYKKIKHERITPYIVKSIQELSTIVEDLQIENNKLKAENILIREEFAIKEKNLQDKVTSLSDKLEQLMVWAQSMG